MHFYIFILSIFFKVPLFPEHKSHQSIVKVFEQLIRAGPTKNNTWTWFLRSSNIRLRSVINFTTPNKPARITTDFITLNLRYWVEIFLFSPWASHFYERHTFPAKDLHTSHWVSTWSQKRDCLHAPMLKCTFCSKHVIQFSNECITHHKIQ